MDTTHVQLPDFASPPASVVLDLDGTLLDSSRVLRAPAREALVRLTDAMIPVVIATARPMRSIRALIGVEILDRLHIVQMNGAASRPHGGPGVERRQMPSDVARHVAALAARLVPGARVVVEIEGEEFGCDMALDAETLWVTNAATPEMQIPLSEAVRRMPAKIAVNGLGTSVGTLAGLIRAELVGSVDVIEEASGTFLNVVPAGASKEAALGDLLGDEPWERMLAFGDDLADIGMLSAAEHGVAMANAHPAVLAVTRFRTLSNDEDGVTHVLEPLLARFR